MPSLRIATRASQLALWQANHVADLIRASNSDVEVEIVHISTQGDRDRDSSLVAFGGVGVFTREVQRAVLDGRADLAVHSLKDLPTDPAEGLTLAAVPERAPRFDALILPQDADAELSLDTLPAGSVIGTGSPRRRAQLLRKRPDIQFAELRGNVDTRLRKLDEHEVDALILAEAGLERLGLADRISASLKPPLVYPAVGQGALGIECRADDSETQNILSALNHTPTLAEVTAERATLRTLRAGCHAPVGTWAREVDGKLLLDAVVLSNDGTEYHHVSIDDALENAEQLGITVAEELVKHGAASILNPADS
ncbi:hydroxymethylbilane synthase [Calycomorphotria hydatis]|uniref:Porphobilinogen deaminase n=1 Tax=Calycomorphotria hydatis TaxID=2528027 RepID=A0A517TCL1_9PLAN|nr:hydroxymethylbilane synthase [Calycomorphotria hydatis]QDT66115.1 Porphobilinogen deaminase [Calycomorphotria hydatis]